MKEKIIYALGYFDGVHLGHQALLSRSRSLAQAMDCRSGAVTFLGHPDALLTGAAPVQINTFADRKALLSQRVDRVLELPFDKTMMETPWERFLDGLIQAHQAVGFVCGSDFRFGCRGQGTAELLEKFCRERNLSCEIVPQQSIDGIRISSTYIRTLLEQGNMEEAARFLGHPHVLSGRVIAGKQLGRTIGIPTANMAYGEELAELPYGVYACQAALEGKKYMAVTNVGIRPTVEGERVNAESWLLDFSGDLYGKTLTLRFYKYLRPEQKFPDLCALKAQIEKDRLSAIDALKNPDL